MNPTERLAKANELIEIISNCGRRFFRHEGFVSTLELSETGRVFFIDYYTKRRIYTHYPHRWKGFTSGGTMKGLIEALRDYVTKGDLLNIDYFIDPGGDFSHPWMYGDDLNIVRAAVIRLGIAK